jgi:hypothetical protein
VLLPNVTNLFLFFSSSLSSISFLRLLFPAAPRGAAFLSYCSFFFSASVLSSWGLAGGSDFLTLVRSIAILA